MGAKAEQSRVYVCSQCLVRCAMRDTACEAPRMPDGWNASCQWNRILLGADKAQARPREGRCEMTVWQHEREGESCETTWMRRLAVSCLAAYTAAGMPVLRCTLRCCALHSRVSLCGL